MRLIHKVLLGTLMMVGALCMPTQVEAVTRTVCASGCDFTTLNAALAVATGGDVITLAAGQTFVGCTTLPNKGNQTAIQIRSSTADANLPNSTTRIVPGTHGPFMATITACTGGAPAIKMEVGAQDYILGPGLKFNANPEGFNQVIELGNNNTTQRLEADQPGDVVVDRIWIAGSPVYGQKIGVDLNGRNLTLKNSYIENIVAVGQDATAVRIMNGTGPFTIENNFLSGGAEEFLSGGVGPEMKTSALVSAGATNTAATLNTFSNGHTIGTMKVGQWVSFLAGSGTTRYFSTVRSCGTSTSGATCTSANITYDALPAAPDTGAASSVVWGITPTGITIRRNHFYKPMAWLQPILATNGTVTPTTSTASGTLPADTYYYRVSPMNTDGYTGTDIFGNASSEVSATLSATGQVTLNWSAVTNANAYRVYRATTSGVYAGYIQTATNSLVDAGQALTGTSAPPSGTQWVIKNHLEIKYGINVQIDSNYFENSFTGVDNGSCIWMKNNANSGAYYVQSKNIIFEKNILNGCPGFFNILGRIDTASAASWSYGIDGLTIRNNLGYNSNTAYLTPNDPTQYAIKITEPTRNVVIENNTLIHTMKGLIQLIHAGQGSPKNIGLVLRNNIWQEAGFGIFGVQCTEGSACLTAHTEGGTYTYAGNVLGDSTGANYPTGNIYASLAVFTGTTNFTNYATNDFSLKSGSPWKGTAVGGGDPGANIATVLSATTGVTSGTAETTTAPNITTATPLANVVEDVAMSSVTFAVSGGTAPFTWSVNPGSTLPSGLSLSTGGVLSGTPPTPGTYNFTIKVTDSTVGGALTDTQAYTLTVTPTSSTLNILTTTLTATEVASNFTKQLEVTGGTPPYDWSVNTGSSLPSWLTLTPDGVLSGVSDAVGTFNFTVKVTDAIGGTDTQALSIVSAAETMACARTRRMRSGGLTFERASFRRSTAPTSDAPDCAMRGDGWFHTGTNQVFIATASNPVVWSLDTAGGNEGIVLDNDETPGDGDLIIGTEDGTWRRVTASELRGLDAAAITTGIISADRLPAQSSGGGWTTVALASNQATTSTSLIDLPGMSWSVAANTSYAIECTFGVTTNAVANGYLISWNGPASPLFTGATVLAQSNAASTMVGASLIGNDSPTNGILGSSLTTNTATLRGVWRNGATAGTLQFRYKSEGATAGDTITILAGSVCRYSTF